MNLHLRSIALAAAALAACRTPPPPAPMLTPSERLARAESAASAPDATAAAASRAALLAELVTGDPAQAAKWIERSLAKDPADPAAHDLRARQARDRLDETALAAEAIMVLLKAPASLEAELAAALLGHVAQDSPRTDDALVTALAPLERGSLGLSGKAAVRAREALLSAIDGRADDALAARLRAANGTPSAWALVGPLGTMRVRGFEAASPFDDRKHVLQKEYSGPLGRVLLRRLPTPGGALSLEPEPSKADLYEAFVDLDVREGGAYLASVRGAAMATVFVDGEQVLRRRTYPRRAPERSWGAFSVEPGRHRVRVRFTRAEANWLAISLTRADGAPADFSMTAPEAGQPAPDGRARAIPTPPGALEGAAALTLADPADPAGWWLRARLLALDDAEAARDLLPQLVATAGESAPLRAFRIELTSIDPDVPRSNASARISRDLDALLTQHPRRARALQQRLDAVLADKRWDVAEKLFAQLLDATGGASAGVLVRKARFLSERGETAGARAAAERALELDPGRCDALDFRYDLARRDDELTVADELAKRLERCPGGLAANGTLLKQRGRLDEARAFFDRLLARNPTTPQAVRALSDLLVAQGDFTGAIAALEPLGVAWPQRAETWERLAELGELAGDPARAAAWRRKALAADGSDLALARATALDAGSEAVAWAARDGLAAIRAYQQAAPPATATAVQVLDLGALEIQSDGSTIERVHSIVQVLDKRGIDRYGEVTIPGDAVPLVVRTVKPDGTLLHAETIAGKDSISLPNLEPGDFIEYEYLRANGSRGAALPGFQGGQFFFAGGDVPFYESTYLVRVPKAIGLELDAHAIPDLQPPKDDGDTLTFAYTRRGSEPWLREPLAASEGEILPWVEAGSGARQADLVRQLSDWLLLRTRATGEIADLVRGVAALPEAERIPAVVARVREAVKGEGSPADFGDGAGVIVSRGRGNRLAVLKAALAAVGIRSHVVLARSFGANPHPFRFPRQDLLSNALLRIEPDGAAPVWMDFSFRQAPVGRLPVALSGAPAWLVPEPDEDVQAITLPEVPADQDRSDAAFELVLGDDGTLRGTVTQSSHGFDAAALRLRLEQTNPADLRRQQERSLNAMFRGLVLKDLEIRDDGHPDSPVVSTSTIEVARYGQRTDGSVTLSANFGAQHLGPRYLGRAERRTPLLLEAPEVSRARARLQLPPGWKIATPPPVDIASDFGRFRASWQLEGSVLSLDEETRLERGRITPEQYRSFKAFAVQVDAAQAREIPVRRD